MAETKGQQDERMGKIESNRHQISNSPKTLEAFLLRPPTDAEVKSEAYASIRDAIPKGWTVRAGLRVRPRLPGGRGTLIHLVVLDKQGTWKAAVMVRRSATATGKTDHLRSWLKSAPVVGIYGLAQAKLAGDLVRQAIKAKKSTQKQSLTLKPMVVNNGGL